MHKQYTHHEMHVLLCEQQLSDTWRQTDDPSEWPQALHCPYYVPLEGQLGADWGIVLNPESTRFGLLTFEHDWCGCPNTTGKDIEYTHEGSPNQEGDMWDVDWKHKHDEFCDIGCREP